MRTSSGHGSGGRPPSTASSRWPSLAFLEGAQDATQLLLVCGFELQVVAVEAVVEVLFLRLGNVVNEKVVGRHAKDRRKGGELFSRRTGRIAIFELPQITLAHPRGGRELVKCHARSRLA